ncbi:MAG: hypothetical protein J6B37_06575 [Clostridia bacterium]|nr:hypothetical protein [Clostridia bacterium]
MKVVYPMNNTTKTIRIPNWLVFNRVLFGALKLFLITKHPLFLKLRYRQIKPLIKKAREYKGFEIVTVNGRHGETVRVFL